MHIQSTTIEDASRRLWCISKDINEEKSIFPQCIGHNGILNAVDIFRQVHALQHELLEIVEEPVKGLGLRLERDVPEGTLIATGLAPMMDREEEERKFVKYVQRHTDWSTWTEETAADDEIRPQYYAADINDESLISVGCMDPSDHNYELSVDRAKQVGLYWWANAPSDTYQVEEHCNVVCGAFKICTGTYAVVLAALTDLPAGAFIHTNYGGAITRHGYKPGVCLSGLECWHCHSSINFPLLHYQNRTTLLNSPQTFEPVVTSRPLRDPTYRPLHRTFTMACIGYEEERAKGSKRTLRLHLLQFRGVGERNPSIASWYVKWSTKPSPMARASSRRAASSKLGRWPIVGLKRGLRGCLSRT